MTDKIEKLVGQAKHGLKDHNMFWSVEAIPVSLDFPAAGVKLYLKSEYSAQVDLTLDDLEALIRVVQETKKETIDDYVIPWADGLYVQQIHPLLLNTVPKKFKEYEINGQLPDVNHKIVELIEKRIKKA